MFDSLFTPRSAWLLAVDHSASMGTMSPPLISSDGVSRTRLQAVKDIIPICLQRLLLANEQNLAGMVAFNNKANLLSPLMSPYSLLDTKPWLGLTADSGTNFSDTIGIGLDILRPLPPSEFGFRKIVLLTDGNPNRANESLADRIDECRQNGIRIDSIAIGNLSDSSHYEPDLLMSISKYTRGWCQAVQDYDQLLQALTRTVV